MKEKNYSKSYKIIQVMLFFAIIISYLFYLLVAGGSSTLLEGIVTPAMIHSIVLLLIVMQIQTIFDMFGKLNQYINLIINIFVAGLAAYLAFQFKTPDIHIGFTIVLVIISFSAAINALQGIATIKNKKNRSADK